MPSTASGGSESEPLRVAFVSPTYFADESIVGGGERWPLNLAISLTTPESGWTVDFISFGAAGRSEKLTSQVTLTLLETGTEDLHIGPGTLDGMSWQLPTLLDTADLVHVHQPLTRSGEAAILIAKALGKPLCITDYGGRSSNLGASLGMLNLADAVICYSKFGASILPHARRVDIVPGGVDSLFFVPGKPTEHRGHLLYAGRILPHKGVDRIIEALPPHLPLVVCGRPYNDQYFELLIELAQDKTVEFVVDADDARLRHLYQHAWATILASVYRDRYGTTYEQPELMGLTALESMSCGTPVIVSDVGALPEFVEHGVTGLIATSDVALREAMISMCTERGTAITMGLAARERVVDIYSMDVVASRIRHIYREVLADHSTSSL